MIKFGNKKNPEWYITKVTGDTLSADEWNLHVAHQRGHAVEHEKGGIQELGLDATQIVSGVLDILRIPDLDAGKIVSGIFDVARIPDLDAGKIVSGIFDVARIPDLDAGKITTGVFSLDRIPTIPYTKTDFADQDLRKSASPIFAGINLGYAVLKALTVDPALLTGRIWFRSDLGRIRFSPDGVAVEDVDFISLRESAITSHSAISNAHHTKTTDAGEIISGRFPMARMPTGDAGLVLTAQGVDVDPIYSSPPAPANIWEVLADIEVPAGQDYVDFTGLNIDEDGAYVLFLMIYNETGSSSWYRIFVEGDYTVANWYTQRLEATGTSVGAGRSNETYVLYVPYGNRGCTTVIVMREPLGWVRFTSLITSYPPELCRAQIFCGCSKVTYTNVTQIRIASTVAGAIGTGSRLILARVKKP